MKPIFSIIIPIFSKDSEDRSSMLNSLLRSIPDREDVEVVLVDDHSPHPIAIDWTFKRANLVSVKNNDEWKYAGTARNKGIDVAQGKYLVFADSDDIFVTNNFDKTLDGVLKEEGWDVAIFPITSFEGTLGNESNRHHAFQRCLQDYQRHPSPEMLVRFHVPYGRIVRAAFVQEHALRFDATRVGNDVMFGMLLGASSPNVIINNQGPAYAVRKHEQSLIGDRSYAADKIRLSIFARGNLLMRQRGIPYRFSTASYLRKYLKEDRKKAILLALWSLSLPGNSPIGITERVNRVRMRRRAKNKGAT